jgi:hypothetical protein
MFGTVVYGGINPCYPLCVMCISDSLTMAYTWTATTGCSYTLILLYIVIYPMYCMRCCGVYVDCFKLNIRGQAIYKKRVAGAFGYKVVQKTYM